MLNSECSKKATQKKKNEVGFAKVATIEEIGKNGYVLTPGRYVGIKLDEDDTLFEEKNEDLSRRIKKTNKRRARVNGQS